MKFSKLKLTYSVCELLIDILFFTILKYFSIGFISGVYYGRVIATIPDF